MLLKAGHPRCDPRSNRLFFEYAGYHPARPRGSLSIVISPPLFEYSFILDFGTVYRPLMFLDTRQLPLLCYLSLLLSCLPATNTLKIRTMHNISTTPQIFFNYNLKFHFLPFSIPSTPSHISEPSARKMPLRCCPPTRPALPLTS